MRSPTRLDGFRGGLRDLWDRHLRPGADCVGIMEKKMETTIKDLGSKLIAGKKNAGASSASFDMALGLQDTVKNFRA